MAERTYRISDVKPVTIENSAVSADGEGIIFTVKDPRGGTGHIMISWSHLPLALQVMTRGAEKCAEVRKTLGKSNHLDASVRAFQLVQTVQVSDIDKPPLKILSLQNPAGLRCDFAIPTNTVDQLGRSIPRAIAEELLRDDAAERKKPM